MSLFRRGSFFLVSVLLLISLVGLAFAISSNLTLAKPAKVESLLQQSKFYDKFADNIITQAQTSANNNIGSGKVNFKDPQVMQAAHEALSTTFLQKQGNSIIENNYAWLKGQKAQPDFRVDLTSTQQDFANRVGQAAAEYLSTRQVCNTPQLTQLQASGNQDPFSWPCLPATEDPATVGAALTKEINDNVTFLNSPVITPTSLDPTQSEQTTPYYQKLSSLPKVYQVNLRMPYVWAALAIALGIFVFLLAPTRRRAFRRLMWVLIVSGVVLVLNKVIADFFFDSLQKKVVASSASDQVSRAILDFLHSIEAHLVKIDLNFGVLYLVLAVAILIGLRLRRAAPARAARPAITPVTGLREGNAPVSSPRPELGNFQAARNSTSPDVVDVAPPSAPTLPTGQNQPTPPYNQPRRKRPPRLIQ